MMEIVRWHNPAPEETITEPIGIDLARDIVRTAHDIIERMDGRRMTPSEQRTVLADAFDLAFYITGEPGHLDAEGIEARAQILAGA